MTAPLEVELPRDPSASALVRRVLADLIAGTLEGPELSTAKLLVSELVSDEVRHGQGTITLKATLHEDRLLVEVIDDGTGFEREIRDHDFERVGWWGLSLVELEASRWGVHEGTTHVWFEIERPGAGLGAEHTSSTADDAGSS